MPPPDTTDSLFPIVYEELKRIARHQLTAANPSGLSTTELVHETFLKLSRGDPRWEGRAHFFGAASRAMREVLVDFARRRLAEKRGGGARAVSLGEAGAALEIELDQVVALDDALKQLDAEFEAVSASLKVPFYVTFWKVTVPVCLPAILDISIYLFVNAMTTVSAVIFIYSPDTKLASVAVINMDDNGMTTAATAMAMMIVSAVSSCLILFPRTPWPRRFAATNPEIADRPREERPPRPAVSAIRYLIRRSGERAADLPFRSTRLD